MDRVSKNSNFLHFLSIQRPVRVGKNEFYVHKGAEMHNLSQAIWLIHSKAKLQPRSLTSSTGALAEAQCYQETNLPPKWILHSRWAATIMRLLETAVLSINHIRLTPQAVCRAIIVSIQDTSGLFCMHPVSAGDLGASMCSAYASKLLGEGGRGLLSHKSH